MLKLIELWQGVLLSTTSKFISNCKCLLMCTFFMC